MHKSQVPWTGLSLARRRAVGGPWLTASLCRPPRKEYVAALQARVKTLEAELALARESGWGGDSGSVAGTEPPAFNNEDDVASPESTASHGTSGTSSAAIEEVTDILGRFAIGDGGELCYFGSRSNFNLLRSSTVRSMSNMDMQRRGYEAAAAQVGLVGVSRDLQSHLLHLFWSWQNSWQYIVCEGPFLQDLGSHPDSPFGRFCSPALLYAILALASRYTDDERVRTDPEDPRTAGDAFAAQARVMLLYECETPTPTTVQALALTCLREMALNKEALGWMYCGMCVRMAINLGMHLDCSPCVSEGTLSAEEAEVRNVTWWGCYVLDKYRLPLPFPGKKSQWLIRKQAFQHRPGEAVHDTSPGRDSRATQHLLHGGASTVARDRGSAQSHLGYCIS